MEVSCCDIIVVRGDVELGLARACICDETTLLELEVGVPSILVYDTTYVCKLTACSQAAKHGTYSTSHKATSIVRTRTILGSL